MRILPAVAVLVSTLLLSVPASAAGENFLSGWGHRMGVDIHNPGAAASDVQVLVVVDTAIFVSGGKMDPTCSDLRVTDSDGSTLLPFWIEGGCNTLQTAVWVRVPSLPAASTSRVYLYYGSVAATPVSSIPATFVANKIAYFDGACTSSMACGYMDTHWEADVVRGEPANNCRGHTTHIAWASICNGVTSSGSCCTREQFYTRFRFLFDPPTTGTWSFAVDSDDGSEFITNPGDATSGHLLSGHSVITSWYGGHGACGCPVSGVNVPLTAGQGAWYEFLYSEWFGGERGVLYVRPPGATSYQPLDTAVHSGIYARNYPASEPAITLLSEERAPPPAPPVPELATLALAGVGLAAVAVVVARRR